MLRCYKKCSLSPLLSDSHLEVEKAELCQESTLAHLPLLLTPNKTSWLKDLFDLSKLTSNTDAQQGPLRKTTFSFGCDLKP